MKDFEKNQKNLGVNHNPTRSTTTGVFGSFFCFGNAASCSEERLVSKVFANFIII
jgi:hypothetical protein